MGLAPGARLGVYEIVGLIGAGGMGEVYRARDARLNRDVLGGSPPMMRIPALLVVASLLPAYAQAQTATRRVFVDAMAASGAPVVDLRADEFEVTEGGERRDIASAKVGHRPSRIVLVVDATDGIRQPIGLVRKGLAELLQNIDPQHEMMLVTVAGTPQVRVRPTVERQQLVKSVDGIFGTSGANVMHRVIDDLFHRFALTTDSRPIFVVLTTEGHESTQNINPQEIAHLTDHFKSRGGTLHAIRLNVPSTASTFRDGNLTEMPVSLMIGRDTGGAYTNISPNGLLEVLQRLAPVINEAHASTLSYQIEFASAPVKGKKPAAPQVRVLRDGLSVNVISTP